jgi:hypothetical protein
VEWKRVLKSPKINAYNFIGVEVATSLLQFQKMVVA